MGSNPSLFMSDYPLPTGQNPTELDYATFARDHRINRSVFLAGLAILIYDYFLNFGKEIKYIWSSKLRPGTCWFLAIRYYGLGANIVICAYNFVDINNHEVCVNMQWTWMIVIVFAEFFIEVSLSLRVFAMYGLNKWILACLLSANACIAIVGLFDIIEYGKNPDLLAAPGFSGCDAAYGTPTAIARVAGVWGAILACDILVFALTARKAFVQWKTSPVYVGSLLERMAIDGTMYFGIIVLASLANVLTLYVEDAMLGGFLSWLTTNLSLSLLCRLMLNLHEAARMRIDTSLSMGDTETIRFATLLMTFTD
ncbi:hypothetical protein MSAN_01907800 [Mycena sanguinolenta]|uniref:DUF6533 domain-containing protein n=1 Tax=Mycena sanguinolenta TaxID=230812 RepID=A0A8H7CPG4_9AGAR|nr:hypothetical protein MSAN_01907800 [Mycena sanguinolenta]